MKILIVIYDNGSYINFFPLGSAYIASSLKRAGNEVIIYNQDIYHYSEEHLTNYLDTNKFDVVGVGVIAGYYQYKKLLEISEAINKSKNRPIYILGGHGPAPEPRYFLEKTKADFVILGEGEKTVVNLLDNLDNTGTVKGIAYLKDNILITTEKEKPTDPDEFRPEYALFPMDHYLLYRPPGTIKNDRCIPMLSGRGCPYSCAFCFRMTKGFRPRSSESIIDEIKYLKENYYVTSVEFSDELLMSSKKRTIELCEAFLSADIDITWGCSGRLNFADDDVLKIMKRAGCIFINYGIESLDDEVLEKMNKHLTVDRIIKGVENTLKYKIHQGLNIIFGNIGDNKKILKKGVEFLKKYSDASQLRTIRPVTPYPGSPLYYHAIEKGLLKDVADFYENKHLNSDLLAVNFTNMSDEEFYVSLKEANIELASDYYDKNKKNCIDQITNLYDNKDTSFRGFRQL